VTSDGAPYPPAPWQLHGQAHGHLLLVPRDALPATPEGFRPLVVAGHGLVVAGWVDYQGGSILRYRELFAAVAGFAGRRLTGTVTHMWVDSDASRRGGRELWGYPKELAEFELDISPAGSATARAGDQELARGTYRARVTLPTALGARTGTVQPLGGRLVGVRMRVSGRPSLGDGGFTAGAGSPLEFLSGARRVASFGVADFEARFGI
jgi:hypothetical protein